MKVLRQKKESNGYGPNHDIMMMVKSRISHEGISQKAYGNSPKGSEIAYIDYSLFTGASMPTLSIFNVPAPLRFEFEKELETVLKTVFHKYQHLEVR